MEEARITITLKPIYLERLLYWIVILVLGIWLLVAYMGDDRTSDDTGTGDQEQEVATPQEEEDAAVVPIVEEQDGPSCTDDLKNGDETDVDCGGSCGKCAAGESCSANTDCSGGYCVSGECTSQAPTVLSGKIVFTLKGVTTPPPNNATGAIKVTGLDFSIENGMEDDMGAVTMYVYVQSKKMSGVCLNQQPDIASTDCEVPYATITLNGPASGKTLTKKETFEGRYIIPEGSYYDHGDDFNVVVFLKDAAGGDINGKVISGVKTVVT